MIFSELRGLSGGALWGRFSEDPRSVSCSQDADCDSVGAVGLVSRFDDRISARTRSNAGLKGRPLLSKRDRRSWAGPEDEAEVGVTVGGKSVVLCLRRPADASSRAWAVLREGRERNGAGDVRTLLDKGRLQKSYTMVPVKRLPIRVAKYDLCLRENSLRAVHAVHTILTRMVLFYCRECKERFPTFHPAYVPPAKVAQKMELFRHGGDGVAACDVEVFWWETMPPLDAADGIALSCSGTCLRCQKDMDAQLKMQGGCIDSADIVPRRSEENHMDPLFRFPLDDLKELFDGATMVEAMLVALEHMQINFVTVSRSGLRKFRRNVISFPQDIGVFAADHQLFKGFRVGDRVNSVRGPGREVSRAPRRAVDAPQAERDRFAEDSGGALIYPAKVQDIMADGTLVLEYDHGGEGLELPEHVRPRVVMPWHPRRVPLHLMLRRNLGGGKDPLKGLQVRWWYVARLLQALCAFPKVGYGPWRLGGDLEEPMHRYYDTRVFDVLGTDDCVGLSREDAFDGLETELKARYAPKELEGSVLEEAAAQELGRNEAVSCAVDVQAVSHFVAAGFDVNGVGPEADLDDGGAGAWEEFVVEEDVFARWLDLAEMRLGSCVARWWAEVASVEEGTVEGLKMGDDDTTVDLFSRIRDQSADREREAGRSVVGSGVKLSSLLWWLETCVGGDGLGEVGEGELLADRLLHELTVAGHGDLALEDRGCMEEAPTKRDDEEEAVRLAENLVYGWPSREGDPTGVYSRGKFVKSHPLDFPMGIADLYEEAVRVHRVSPEEWVQHMLRYWSGHFVGGLRGQRVIWSMVNTLLLSEARGRGHSIYRNVMRRVGLGLEGGRVLTKGRLRQILESEDRSRVLVHQLSTVGRGVRSTPMQWAFEGKKLDCTVKHLSWVPPWVRSADPGHLGGGCRYMREGDSWNLEDTVGLGRYPSSWWTLNAKYNAAYDVQRFNVAGEGAKEAIDETMGGYKEERFVFARDNPDLVAYLLTLRTELIMRIVMPAVIQHSAAHPYLAMARFEVGASGNPHWHGFSMGIPGPTVGRVRADVEGDGDEVPDLDIEDFVSVLKALEGVGADTEMTMDDLRRVVEGGLEREAERRAQCATGEDEGEAERVGVACDVDAEVSEGETVGGGWRSPDTAWLDCRGWAC